MQLQILLANANNNLRNLRPRIESATKSAEKYLNQNLSLPHNINLIFSDMNLFQIPEDGVGGRTYWYDFIVITIDPQKDPSEDIIFEIICHKAAHAARWSKNTEPINTLFDGIINEGLATVCEAEAVSQSNQVDKQVFLATVLSRTDAENQKILTTLKPQLDSANYNYDEIFFTGNQELPRWAGYSLGYYLVKKYLQTTQKTIWQALFDNYADFR